MQNITAGLVAGFIATVVLSAIMMIKTMMGIMPELDVVDMLAGMMGMSVLLGWVAHFMIGTLAWGGGFALLYAHIPGDSPVAKGVAFGVAAWLAMMVAVMPMAGASLFGLNFGIMAPMMMLALHLVFGAVLGLVFRSRTALQLAH